MCNRVAVTTTLLLLIKSASVEMARDLSDEESSRMEDVVLRAGIHALESLGVTRDEIVEGTLTLVMGSPMMSNIDDDPAVSAWN